MRLPVLPEASLLHPSPVRHAPFVKQSQRLQHCPKSGSGAVVREVLSREGRKKFDETADGQFYMVPKLVKHVDDSFIAAVTKLYKSLIPENGDVLDLMSSWISHLPQDVKYNKVVGHGMNAFELSRNKQLDTFFVRDLNREPQGWAAKDNSYEAVVCCVSVQYLQQPEQVFAEIYRVLKPQGVCIITFSNRLYFQKAIKAWRDASNDFARIQLVKQYFLCVEGFTDPEAYREMPEQVEAAGFGAVLNKVRSLFQQIQQDPFYAVVAYKDSKPS